MYTIVIIVRVSKVDRISPSIRIFATFCSALCLFKDMPQRVLTILIKFKAKQNVVLLFDCDWIIGL